MPLTDPELLAWQKGGRAFVHRGHPVFYRDDGPAGAPVVVCLHGFPTASWDWRPVWGRLTERARAIAPDFIGFGLSAKPRWYDYGIADQAELIEMLLAEQAVGRVHVLAHDYGDTVAQELIARAIDRERAGDPGLEIASVVLLNGGLFPETHQARPIQKLLASPVGGLVTRLMNRKRFGKSFAAVFGPDAQPSEVELDRWWELISLGGGALLGHKHIRYMDERREHRGRWVGALQAFRGPMRLIDGPADPVSGAHMASRYRELVPNADVVLLGEGVGHYPQVEDPSGVLAACFELWEPLWQTTDRPATEDG